MAEIKKQIEGECDEDNVPAGGDMPLMQVKDVIDPSKRLWDIVKQLVRQLPQPGLENRKEFTIFLVKMAGGTVAGEEIKTIWERMLTFNTLEHEAVIIAARPAASRLVPACTACVVCKKGLCLDDIAVENNLIESTKPVPIRFRSHSRRHGPDSYIYMSEYHIIICGECATDETTKTCLTAAKRCHGLCFGDPDVERQRQQAIVKSLWIQAVPLARDDWNGREFEEQIYSMALTREERLENSHGVFSSRPFPSAQSYTNQLLKYHDMDAFSFRIPNWSVILILILLAFLCILLRFKGMLPLILS